MEEKQQATFNFWALSLRILHTSPPLLRLPIYITGNLLLIFFPPSQGNYQGVAFQCCPGAVSFSQHRVIPYEDQTNHGFYTSGKSNGQMGRIPGDTTSMDKLLTSYTNLMLHFTKYRSRPKTLHQDSGCMYEWGVIPGKSTYFPAGRHRPTLHPIQPPSNM